MLGVSCLDHKSMNFSLSAFVFSYVKVVSLITTHTLVALYIAQWIRLGCLAGCGDVQP